MVRDQPAFWKRRGDPRATVEAVNNGLEPFSGTLTDVHGVVRVAPLMALRLNSSWDDLAREVGLAASLTHDIEFVGMPSIKFCTLLARLATSPRGQRHDVITDSFGGPWSASVDRHFLVARGTVDPDHLMQIASNDRADRLLTAALYLAAAEVDIATAIRLADLSADPAGLAALAGAPIGASTGVTQWMEEQFAKHEFVWQPEVLMRNLFVVGLMSENLPAELAARYPAW